MYKELSKLNRKENKNKTQFIKMEKTFDQIIYKRDAGMTNKLAKR